MVAFRQVGDFAQGSARLESKQHPALLYPIWPLQWPSVQHKRCCVCLCVQELFNSAARVAFAPHSQASVCHFYLSGKCTKGDLCAFQHVSSRALVSHQSPLVMHPSDLTQPNAAAAADAGCLLLFYLLLTLLLTLIACCRRTCCCCWC